MHDVVALHGFAGSGRMWDPLGIELLAPDLPGHGTAAAVRPITFQSCVDRVLTPAPERFVLVGYSMGGRIALHVALAAPERVAQLVLISTTAGIEDEAERAARRSSDERFAAEIEGGSIEDFAERWSALPLFAGDPPEAVARWREDMLRNEPAGLAASLRGVGTGAMASLWHRLGELTMPSSVLVGERDARYCAIGERLASALPDGSLTVVAGAGHGLPREVPDAVAASIVRS